MKRFFMVGSAVFLAACSQAHPEPFVPVSLGDRYHAAEKELVELVETDDVPAAMRQLRAIISADSELAGQCHGLIHGVGHAAYHKYGLTEALRFNDDICGSGYTHGVVEQHFENVTDLAKEVDTICPPDDVRCFHGLGHGLMFATENNVPESIRYCSGFEKGFQRIQCAEGVFMENFGIDTEMHASQYLYPADPFRTCREQEEPWRGVCAFYAPRYYVKVHPRAYLDALNWCQSLPEASAQACVKGVGSVTMKENIDNPSFPEEICKAAQTEDLRGYCVQGMVSYYMVHHASAAKGDELCAQVAQDMQPRCQQVVEQSRAFFRS